MGRVYYDKMRLIPTALVIDKKGRMKCMGAFDINKVKIGVVLKHPDAKLPVKKAGNIGIDLACVADDKFANHLIITPDKFTAEPIYQTLYGFWLKAGERHTFSSGVHLNIPDGWAIEYGDRSGNASKRGLTILAGKIDSSYTGECCIVVLNTSKEDVFIQPGERLCQMIVTRDWDSEFVLTDSLKDSERGEKGFGSSGR